MDAPLPTVLVVDDDEAVLLLFAQLMKRMPVTLVRAASAERALELMARDGPPAMLISDYQLPGMDGMTLLQGVKTRHPLVRLALCTGTTKVPPAGSGITYLRKPVEVRELQRLIASLAQPT